MSRGLSWFRTEVLREGMGQQCYLSDTLRKSASQIVSVPLLPYPTSSSTANNGLMYRAHEPAFPLPRIGLMHQAVGEEKVRGSDRALLEPNEISSQSTRDHPASGA